MTELGGLGLQAAVVPSIGLQRPPHQARAVVSLSYSGLFTKLQRLIYQFEAGVVDIATKFQRPNRYANPEALESTTSSHSGPATMS